MIIGTIIGYIVIAFFIGFFHCINTDGAYPPISFSLAIWWPIHLVIFLGRSFMFSITGKEEWLH